MTALHVLNEFRLRNIRYCLYLTLTCEHRISYKNFAACWSRNTALGDNIKEIWAGNKNCIQICSRETERDKRTGRPERIKEDNIKEGLKVYGEFCEDCDEL